MKLDSDTIAEAAQRIGIKPEELAAVLQRGTAVTYEAGDYLFHESTPRQWLGLVIEGEIDLVRGQHGQSVLIGVAQPGAILSEGVMLDDTPHGTSAVTRQGAKVWQIPRAELDKVRAENPEVFYRIVGQIARRLSDRLRAAVGTAREGKRRAHAHQRPPRARFARRTRRAEPRLLRRADPPRAWRTFPSPASTSGTTNISSARSRA